MRLAMIVAMILASVISAPVEAQEGPQDPTTLATNTYAWTGEVVSLDNTLRTMTVKARLTGPEAVNEPARFKPGDRILLDWFGYGAYTSAVREVRPYDATQSSMEPFQFPAELVSLDTQSNYITIKFRAPQRADGTMKSLKPGNWVRVRSRQNPTSAAEAVVDVTPFLSLGS